MKKIIPLVVFGLILMTSFILATNCPPGIPKVYTGEVFYDDGNFLTPNELLDDHEYPLRALNGNDVVGVSSIVGGEYEIKISPCFGSTGEITFVINGIAAETQGMYDGQEDWGEEENMDLIFEELPPFTDTCGDNAIQLGEECDGINFGAADTCGEGWEGTVSCTSSCTIDYSQCSVIEETENSNNNSGDSGDSSSGSSSSGGSSGGGGGGSSGGGSSGGSSGGSFSSSSSSSSTGNTESTTLLSASDNSEKQEKEISIESTNNKEGFGPSFMNFFAESKFGIISLILIVLIFSGAAVLFYGQKKNSLVKTKKSSHIQKKKISKRK